MSESAKIYCRCRCVFPWEASGTSVKFKGKTVIQNKTKRGNNAYTFTEVFNEESTNEQVFEKICTPLIKNVIGGHNAVLIAYGQTGSGKTHSLVGKPEQNVQGLLPRTLHKLLEVDSVTKVELLAVEAYGVHVARIEIFDLFGANAAPPDWSDKKGKGAFDIRRAERRILQEKEDSDNLINEAHDASHFAPTSKNPESSRGHTVFIIRVEQEAPDGMSSKTSYFVVADLAGSEGDSAITKEFIQNNNPTTVMVRRLEAGCINAGLCQLQLIFNELKKRGKLSCVVGNGLRRLLHPFINTNTHISVLFTVAPTKSNSSITESTLKFAVQAGMVKVQPVAAAAKKNLKKMLKQLEQTVEDQAVIIVQKDEDIEEKEELIEELENQIEHLQEKNEQLLDGIPEGQAAALTHAPKKPQTPRKAREHKRNPTIEQAEQLFANLNQFVSEMDDDYDSADSPVVHVPVLGNLSALEEDDEDGEQETAGKKTVAKLQSVPKEKTEQEIEIDKKVYSRERARHSIRFEQSIINHIGIDPKILNEEEEDEEENSFEYNDDLMDNIPDEIFQNFDDLENDDCEKLIEKIEALKTLLREKEVMCEQYKEAQLVMMDHLAQTNEALFHFFKVRYKIPGEKKARTGGIYTN